MDLLELYNETIAVMTKDDLEPSQKAVKLAELRTGVQTFLSELDASKLKQEAESEKARILAETERANLLTQISELQKSNTTLLTLMPRTTDDDKNDNDGVDDDELDATIRQIVGLE